MWNHSLYVHFVGYWRRWVACIWLWLSVLCNDFTTMTPFVAWKSLLILIFPILLLILPMNWAATQCTFVMSVYSTMLFLNTHFRKLMFKEFPSLLKSKVLLNGFLCGDYIYDGNCQPHPDHILKCHYPSKLSLFQTVETSSLSNTGSFRSKTRARGNSVPAGCSKVIWVCMLEHRFGSSCLRQQDLIFTS